MHLIKAYVGTGILALPQAFMFGGIWVVYAFLQFFNGFLNLKLSASSGRLVDENVFRLACGVVPYNGM